MENGTVDTYIDGCAEFGAQVVNIGEQVFLYRRRQDAHDPNLIAVVNEVNEPLGFVDTEIASTVVLPALKEGVRFQCVINGEMAEDRIPMQMTSIDQAEVSAILARRGIRRSSAGGLPPLAGLFDAEPEVVEEDEDEEADDGDVEADAAADADADADADANGDSAADEGTDASGDKNEASSDA
jgi:hypothetical protein